MKKITTAMRPPRNVMLRLLYYVAVFIGGFFIWPFLLGGWLIRIVYRTIASPLLKYGLITLILIPTSTIGAAWAAGIITSQSTPLVSSSSSNPTTTPTPTTLPERTLSSITSTPTPSNSPTPTESAIPTASPTPSATPSPSSSPKPSVKPSLAPTIKPSSKPTTPAVSQNCDSNYSGDCVPIASDVDCASGSGNGPAYVKGPVTVIGRDIYNLDSDNDGIGCER